jgi:hypothetical protein
MKIEHERTTQQSTKAMETTRAATTRTAKARAKARSRVCNCVDCCCCCCPLWDSLTLRNNQLRGGDNANSESDEEGEDNKSSWDSNEGDNGGCINGKC